MLIVINGKPSPSYKWKTVLHIGRFMIMSLFVVDVLSRSIWKRAQAKVIVGLKLSKFYPELTHLFFADDSLFLFRANFANSQEMAMYIQEYCNAYKQMVNFDNSSFIFSSNVLNDFK